jgi:hypothetical protein
MGNLTFGGPQLPRRLTEYTGEPSPSYRDYLYPRIVDGVIPAEFTNGRWRIREADLPLIVAILGLKRTQAAA